MAGGQDVNARLRGVTLIELLVVLTVIGLLMAIAIPAVMAVRGAARRTQCANNLHQLAVAAAGYTSQSGVLVPALGYASCFVQLLPHLDEQALYDRFNWRGGRDRANHTVASSQLSVLVCPDDGSRQIRIATGNGSQRTIAATTHYSGNLGSWIPGAGRLDGTVVYMATSLGYPAGPLRIADVTDGTSQTALFAEQLPADRTTDDDARLVGLPNDGVAATDRAAFVSMCETLDRSKLSPVVRGSDWTDGNIGRTLYTHAGRPGTHGCYNRDPLAGSMPPASRHGGGFQLAYVDGHVAFIDDSIDPLVWLAIGSRDGGEVSSR